MSARVPQWLQGLFRWCVKWGLVVFTLVVAVVLFYFFLALRYDLRDVGKMPERSVILDRNGTEIGTIHGERRRLIAREEIPEIMVQALRAREDLRFPYHHGVDVRGLARATLRNVRDMKFSQGGSTLTMQLARNSYDLRAKSLHRKMLEMAVTLRIEHRYGKDEILTHYLNRIYFGSGCHGVEEAAQTYFGRSVSRLNTGECAMLVGIIRGPHLFSPFRNLAGAKVQRNEVLRRMVDCGFLTEEERLVAERKPTRLVPEKDRRKGSSYMRESVRRHLNVILDRHDIRDGGLSIHTTLDAGMQERCERAMGGSVGFLEEGRVTDLQGAVVKLDPKTGGILALVGGRDFSRSAFNRASHAKRDLGPIFEPFLHALALERGKVPLPGRPLQTGRQLGVDETIRLCKRFGFTGPFREDEDVYRGGLASSPMELAVAGAVLSNNGRRSDPYFIAGITDAQGRSLYEAHIDSSQAISGDSADDVVEGMDGDAGRKSVVASTISRRDAWGVVFGADVVTAIWLGHDKPRELGSKGAVSAALEGLLNDLIKHH